MSLITRWFVLEYNFQRKIQNEQIFRMYKINISLKFIKSSVKTTNMAHRKEQKGREVQIPFSMNSLL